MVELIKQSSSAEVPSFVVIYLQFITYKRTNLIITVHMTDSPALCQCREF